MRQPHLPAHLAAMAALAILLLALGSAGVGAQDGAPAPVFLPLAVHRIGMDQLPTPAAPPTATRPPTLTPTVEVPPTITPEPSATPTLALGATITGLLTVDGRPLWEGTGDGVGPGLFLQLCPAVGECTFVGRTAVDAEGRYRFTVNGALSEGDYYQVVWWNSSETVQDYILDGADLYLGRWFGPRIASLEAEEVVEMATVDLGDIHLLSPTAGTGFQGFPIPFTWSAWPGGPARYRWSLCKCCQTKAQRVGAYQESVGAALGFELTGLPRGFRWDERYCWYIQVDMGDELGYGESFAVRMMWFIPEFHVGAPGTLPGAPAGEVPTCGG